MKIDSKLLNELTMIAQQVLAPDEIGMDVNIHLSTGLVHDAVRAVVEAICPCVVGEPCSSACSCANSCMSGGCSNCSRHGSAEQRQSSERRIRFINWLAEVGPGST